MLKHIFFVTHQYVYVILIIVLGLSGCTTTQEDTANVSAPQVINTHEIIVTTYESSPSPASSASSLSSIVTTPSFTPLSTKEATPTAQAPVIMPVSTLTIAQEGELLSLLMEDNGGCGLPCWWGVTPGTTKVQVVHDMFISKVLNGWERSSDYEEVGLGYPYPDYPYYSRDTIVRFWIEDDLINFIKVSGGPVGEDTRPVFNQDWGSFSPDKMLERYGVPSLVGFREPEQSPYYSLILSYDELGIEIGYIIPYELLNNGNKKICFDSEIYSITLMLYGSGQSETSPVTLISDSDHIDSYISWEETTDSDLIAFQQLFEDVTGSPCVEVEAK